MIQNNETIVDKYHDCLYGKFVSSSQEGNK